MPTTNQTRPDVSIPCDSIPRSVARTVRWAGVIAIAALALSVTADAQLKRIDIALEPVLAATGVHPGQTLQAAIQAELEPGYHVNAHKPLESFLIPTTLTFTEPEGITVQEVVYPEPIMLAIGGLDTPLAVLEERFILGVAFAVDGNVAPGEYLIPGKLRYQACDDQACYAPASKEITLALNVVPVDTPVEAQQPELFASIPFGQGTEAGDDAKPVMTSEGPLTSPEDAEDVQAMLDEWEVLATESYTDVDGFLAFIDEAETGERRKGLLEGRGPIAVVGVILIGGLLLNLTPCVLPMIPINLGIIGAGAQSGSRARGFALGGTYGVAMAAVYGALGLVVVVGGGTFGTINASPWFNLSIALLFIVLALAMFDVIPIDFSKWQAKLNPTGKAKKGTFLLAFFMGAVSALLAGACVAPVVIAVILYAGNLYLDGHSYALALPFLLGLGMALPWPFAGAGMSLLPKPGMWMVRVKQAFGVFIMAFAVYYAWQAYELYEAQNVDEALVAESVDALLEEGWYASLEQGLAAAKAENKPVLLDVWATWCKNCLVMDKTVLKDEQVLARLEDYIKIKYQAQQPDEAPASHVLEKIDAIGLPAYAILKRRTL